MALSPHADPVKKKTPARPLTHHVGVNLQFDVQAVRFAW